MSVGINKWELKSNKEQREWIKKQRKRTKRKTFFPDVVYFLCPFHVDSLHYQL